MTSMNRRSLLGGLLTAGAVAAMPDSMAYAADQNGGLDVEALTAPATVWTQASAAQPGLSYDRLPGISFIPALGTTVYFAVGGGVRFSLAGGTPGSATFICPVTPAYGTRLREIELYVETGPTDGATIVLFRFDANGTGEIVARADVGVAPGVQTVTAALDHLVDVVNFDYELWVAFHSDGTLRGARIGFVAPAGGLVTVAQARKLDTRKGAKPVVGSITTVDLAPEVPVGARAALVNLTATGTENGGFVTAFPGSLAAPPDTSVLNWTVSNTDIANNAVVGLGGGTTIKLFVGGSPGTATHLLCDVIGYFI